MMNLEDKIIAYLDGTLDETSRAELLHTLSVSPEKRKLLEEHIKLREIISLGHKPASVPLMTERKLAERIPILMQELPYLAERSNRVAPIIGSSTTSYFTLLSRQAGQFFTSRFGQVISLGALALVGGLTWYAAGSNNNEDPHGSLPSTAQTQVAANESGGAKQTDAKQNVGTSAWSPNETTVAGSSDIRDNNMPTALSGSRSSSTYAASSTHSATRATDNERSMHVRSNRTQEVHSSSNSNLSVRDQQSAALNSDASLATNKSEDQRDQMLQTSQQTLDQRNSASNNVEANAASNNAASSNAASNNGALDNAVIKQTEDKNANSADPANSIKDPSELPSLPLPSKDRSVTGRVIAQLDYSGGFSVRPNVELQKYETSSGIGFPVFGVGYEFDQHWAIGAELGKSSLAQQQQEKVVTPRMNPGPAGSTPISVNDRVTYTTGVNDVNALWTVASLRYTFNPEGAIPLELSGGAGAAFVNGISPMLAIGAGTTFELVDRVALTLGATARGAWLTGQNAPDEASSTVGGGNATAVVSHRPLTDDLFSSSISGRIGLRIGLF